MVERETIKVPKSMVRVHPVSLLFLQKGENGCLSNNLTYCYAIRIRSGELDRVKQEATNDAINQAMILLLTLPLEVLMDHYWTKTYAKRIPEFTEHVLEYYEKWQNDELDMDKLKEDLWVYGGVRLEEVEGK